MNHRYLKILGIVAGIFLLLAIQSDLHAQCPMCRMTAESNLANGGTGGKGLNIGILFMLSLPYLIVGTIGYVWWKNNRRTDP
jgi:hypothetical protein